LKTNGILVDFIKVLHNVSALQKDENRRQRWIRDVHTWAPERKIPQTTYTPTNEYALNAYWRTITSDRHLDKRIPYSVYADYRNGWLDDIEYREVPDQLDVLDGWRFGRSLHGLYCMVPSQGEVGDIIAILFGASVPYLLREENDTGQFKLIGEVYVHGFMDGEVSRYLENRPEWCSDWFCKAMEFEII
jgi:hypothetical protein